MAPQKQRGNGNATAKRVTRERRVGNAPQGRSNAPNTTTNATTITPRNNVSTSTNRQHKINKSSGNNGRNSNGSSGNEYHAWEWGITISTKMPKRPNHGRAIMVMGITKYPPKMPPHSAEQGGSKYHTRCLGENVGNNDRRTGGITEGINVEMNTTTTRNMNRRKSKA